VSIAETRQESKPVEEIKQELNETIPKNIEWTSWLNSREGHKDTEPSWTTTKRPKDVPAAKEIPLLWTSTIKTRNIRTELYPDSPIKAWRRFQRK
jgi:hypothetical protein